MFSDNQNSSPESRIGATYTFLTTYENNGDRVAEKRSLAVIKKCALRIKVLTIRESHLVFS